MKIKIAIALTLATGILAGCSSMKVSTEREKEFDFGKIKTYHWIAGPAEILDDTDLYINEDVQKAFDAELAGRGIRQVTKAEAARADVQVAYFIKLREHQEYASVGSDGHEFSGGFTYSRKSGTWSYAEREPDLSAYVVETGKLTLLIYDAKTGKRVWRGILQTEIDRSHGKDAALVRIQDAAKKLISQLPEN